MRNFKHFKVCLKLILHNWPLKIWEQIRITFYPWLSHPSKIGSCSNPLNCPRQLWYWKETKLLLKALPQTLLPSLTHFFTLFYSMLSLIFRGLFGTICPNFHFHPRLFFGQWFFEKQRSQPTAPRLISWQRLAPLKSIPSLFGQKFRSYLFCFIFYPGYHYHFHQWKLKRHQLRSLIHRLKMFSCHSFYDP